ncbi:hypothetical protein VTK26DRAFT_3316 [Humicola hyalothermophila]
MTVAISETLPKGVASSPDTIENAPFSPSEKAVPTGDATDEESGPLQIASATQELERWNQSFTTICRYLSANYSFVLMGMTDAAVGALLPYIGDYYSVSYTVVSLVFLSPFGGYILAALTNNFLHHHFGQRGVAFLGPFSRLIGIVTLVFHPPYPALPVVLILLGYGNGIEDSGWNAWIGNMQRANELLGFLHGSYGAGATIAPLIATAMVTKAGLSWWTFYYVMIGADALALVVQVASFWRATGREHRARIASSGNSGTRATTRNAMRSPISWLIALCLLGTTGVEVSLAGWVVTFMLDVRDADPFYAGLTVTFFWLGLTVGRLVLGFVTARIGEKLAITVYLLAAIALQLLYWLVPNFAAAATFITFLGFFIGPLFPAAIVTATKLLPSDYHVSAIGFAAAVGSSGASLFPFAIGAAAQSKGVEVLQPIALAIIVFILLVWLLLPGGLRPGGLELAKERGDKVGDDFMKAARWLKNMGKRRK